ncbi:MAG: malectin domain-containing carbohydrate-binding protein [Bryobacteraceae bacterium]
MGTSPEIRRAAEREELEYVLSSGVVDPESNPGKLLRYLCEKYFDGADADLKERNIAMDVFHRLASFDKRSDSIVRVEAHRLRKRLAGFYAGPGRDRPLRILIPVGQYAPVIEANTPLPAGTASEPALGREFADEEDGSLAAERTVAAAAPMVPRPWFRAAVLAAAVLVAGVAIAWSIHSRPAARGPASASGSRSNPDSMAASAEGGEVRILAGYTKEPYLSRRGNVWLGDRFYHGGNSYDDGPALVARAYDPVLFESRRDGLDFSYDIPAKPGKYELRLYFREFRFGTKLNPGGENSRMMDVSLNGTTVLHEFDIYSEAGGSDVGHIRAFRDVSPASDGMVHIRFVALNDRALVNAIELTPQPPSGIRHIRMVARLSPFVDKRGAEWQPDDYVLGGQLIVRNEVAAGAADPELYEGERFGNFNYAIPVPAGRYQATVYFREGYFKQPAARVFNVLTDGRMLLQNFDILRETGGQLRPITRTFHDLEPNAQGAINLWFVPVKNYALVDAIEISSE